MISPETIVCPDCQVPIPQELVDWSAQVARCPLCEAEHLLRDELLPSAPFEQILSRSLRPNELPCPKGLNLTVDASESKVALSLRGRLGWPTTKIILTDGSVQVRRFLSRRVLALDEVAAFLAIQTVWTDLVSSETPRHTEWHVAALTAEARGLPLFPVGLWEPARYLASTLNEALLRSRPHGPYRDRASSPKRELRVRASTSRQRARYSSRGS
jgi:hypothetical protein